MNLLRFKLGAWLLKPFLESCDTKISKDKNRYVKFEDKDKSLTIRFCKMQIGCEKPKEKEEATMKDEKTSICKGCELKKECPVTNPEDVKKEGKTVVECKSYKKKTEKQKTERKLMTIKETKLGITAVFSHDDCKDLGLDPDMKTKEAIKEVRKRLGLEV